MSEHKQLPCSGCGRELVGADYEETTATVEVTDAPVFAGRKGEIEVPAWVCPDCGTTTPL